MRLLDIRPGADRNDLAALDGERLRGRLLCR